MANRVILSGRLTNDVEVKVSDKGVMYFNNTIAVRKNFKNANGEYDSDFINIVAFGNTAKYLGDYANKGDKVFIEGSIGTRNYVNKEGNKVYVTEVNVTSAEILARKKERVETAIPEIDVPVEDNFEIDEKIDLPF